MDLRINEIGEKSICTTNEDGKGLCMGDHGNPLVIGNTLVGISSWFVECFSKYPNVYTNVYAHREWIQENSNIKKYFF